MQKHKIGIHVTGSDRDGYGPLAPNLVAVTSLHAGAFDEVDERCIKIFRTQAIGNHKDAPGDFDRIADHDLEGAAEWWWVNHLRAEFMPILEKYGPNTYFQPTNEINSKRIIPYLRGFVKAAEKDGVKLALFGDAGGSPDWDDWVDYWLPFLKEISGRGHIYNRHVYTGLPNSSGQLEEYLTKIGSDGKIYVADSNSSRPFREADLMRAEGVDVPILISELGWLAGWNSLPSNWLPDIMKYNEFMMRHPNIIGGCLWNAGPWETAPNILGGKPLFDLTAELSGFEPEWFEAGAVNQGPIIVEPEPQPEPEAPVDQGGNMQDKYLILERFQNHDWYDWRLPNGNRSNMQVPKNFTVENYHGDNPFGDGEPWNRFGYAEAAFLTTGHNLPPEDRDKYTVYPSNVFPEENVVYKLFSDHAFRSIYSVDVEVEAGKSYEARLDFFADFAHYEDPKRGDYSKVTDRMDPRHGMVEVSVRSWESNAFHAELDYQSKNNVSVKWDSPVSGKEVVTFEFLSSYAMAPNVGVAGFFITEMSVKELASEPVTPDPEPQPEPSESDFDYVATAILLPQDVPFHDLVVHEAWDDLTYDIHHNRRSIFWSHHDAVAAASRANTGSKVVIYGDRPEAVELATKYGIPVEVRQRPDEPSGGSGDAVPDPEPPTNPDSGSPLDQPKADGYLYGIDVSRWQGQIDYSRLNSDCRYVFAKATEGSSWVDPMYIKNVTEAKKLGLVTGAYHFFHYTVNVVEQANNFVEQYRKAPTDFIIVDVESNKDPDKYIYTSALRNYIRLVESLLGIKPVIYTSLYMWGKLTTRPAWSTNYPLWAADYNASNGVQFPAPWEDWTFWQFTDKDTSMIGRNCDVNRFRGSVDDLRALANSLVIKTDSEPDQIEEPAPTGDYNLLDYLVGQDGGQYMFKTYSGAQSGSQERYRYEVGSDHWYIIKNHQWEKYNYDFKYIYSNIDTSPGDSRFYVVRNVRDGGELIPRCPRYMSVGQSWVGKSHWVQFHNKDGCTYSNENSGWATNTAEFIEAGDYIAPSGYVYEDTITLKLGTETHVYQKGRGRIAWISDWGEAAITPENVSGQAPLQRERLGCFGE